MSKPSNDIVAVVGLSGTGKSVVTRRLVEAHGYRSVYFGGVVIGEVQRRGLPVRPDTERAVREELRETHGMAAMAVLLAPEILALREAGERVVIDGLYSFAEYEYLTEDRGLDVVSIAVHSAREVRYRRLGQREVRPLTPEQVDERDEKEVRHLDKAPPIVLAGHHIVNDGTEAALYAAVDAIVAG